MRVSASKLAEYRKCPRSYRYKYRDRLDREFAVVSPAMALGDSVHAALCAFFRDPDPAHRTREQLAQLLRRNWRRDCYRDMDEERRYGLQALEMLDRYYFRHDMTVTPLLLEHDFSVRLGGVTLQGKIDRVDALPDGSHCLIDYKSGRNALTLDDAHDDLQLTVYALAFHALYGKPCERLELHYLALDHDLATMRNAEQLAAARRNLAALAETISADREFAPRVNVFCPSCPFAIICPAGGDPQADEVQRLDAANRRLYLLLQAGNELAASELNPATVLERAVATLGELLGAPHTAALRISDDHSHWLDCQMTGAPAAARDEFLARSEVAQCLQQEDMVLRNRAPADGAAALQEAFLPLTTRQHCRGLLYAGRDAAHPYTQNDLNLLRMYAMQTALALENAAVYREAICDRLTGIYNRARFDWALDRELLRAGQGVPFAIYLFDIDNFKKFNDTYGHLIGDYVLQATARTAVATARKCDIVCRYGGEEFVVIFPGADLAGAMDGAERIRHAIAQNRLAVDDLTLAITVSGGVAACPAHGVAAAALVNFADQGLYRAKQLGKNRVALPDSA